MDYYQFVQMTRYFSSPTQASVLDWLTKSAKHLSDKIKLYLDLLLDSLFERRSKLTLRIMRELQELIDDPNQRVYLQYAFLAKKVVVKFERKGLYPKVNGQQLDNFAFFFRKIFEKEKEQKQINGFLMYSILRFASFIETPEGESLIQKFRRFPLVDQSGFWKVILNYMAKNVYNHLDDKKKEEEKKKATSNFIKSMQGFFKMNKNSNKESAPKASKQRSFKEISGLIFRIGIRFAGIVDILLILAKDCGIAAAVVRQMTIRKKDLLYFQILDKNKVNLSIPRLESMNSLRSYQSHANESLEGSGETNLPTSQPKTGLDSSIVALRKKVDLRLFQIIKVVRLSLKYLTVRYDEQGALVYRKRRTLGLNDSQTSLLRDSEIAMANDTEKIKVINRFF